MRQSPFWSNVSPSLEGRCSVLSHPESRKWAQRAAKQPCHPFANCTGFGVLAFELHDTGPIVKTAMIFHQTPQSPHNLRQTSMYRHYDNTMPSHDYLKKKYHTSAVALRTCGYRYYTIYPRNLPSAKKSLVQCHTWTSQGICQATGGSDHRIGG